MSGTEYEGNSNCSSHKYMNQTSVVLCFKWKKKKKKKEKTKRLPQMLQQPEEKGERASSSIE